LGVATLFELRGLYTVASFEVDKESLGTAATALSLLPRDINQVAPLGAEAVSKALPGSDVGTALGKADAACTTAKAVLTGRFNEFAALLQLSADEFSGQDEDAANRIAAVSDYNAGNPDVCLAPQTQGK